MNDEKHSNPEHNKSTEPGGRDTQDNPNSGKQSAEPSPNAAETWEKFPVVFDLLDKHQQQIHDSNFVETVEQQLRMHTAKSQKRIPAPEMEEDEKPLFIQDDHRGAPPPPISRARPIPPARKRKQQVSGIGWVIAAVGLLGAVGIIGLFTLLVLNPPKLTADDSIAVPTAGINIAALPTAVSFRTEANNFYTGQALTLDNGYSFILEPWDGESRWTVLLMGLDRRPGDRGMAYRTDTMILVSVDPQTGRIGMMNIPRDLWVAVPGYSARHRINAPMALGESWQAGSGPSLAMSTVQYNLGIRVHDYVVVDFKAVTDIVNSVGGITVNVEKNIRDYQYPNMYYGYDPFFIDAGVHTLDGDTALKYARTRHGDSDIERNKRQQQVILAIRERILDAEMIPQLILNAPRLLDSLDNNLYTSMNLGQIIELAWYLKDVPAENVKTGVLDFRYLSDYLTPDAQQVLILNSAALPNLMTEVFGPNYAQ